MTIILGIDPGSKITGYGVIGHIQKKTTWIASGCMKIDALDFPTRLKFIYQGVKKIIFKYKPDFFAIEQIFISKNVNSGLKLSHARAAAIIAAVNNNLPVFEYASTQVKNTVVGYGNAKKNQVQFMVKSLLNLSISLKSDEADALAIAITHCHYHT